MKSRDRISCELHSLWYKQLFRVSEDKRKELHALALEKIKEAKPDAFEFINKNGCKLVGFMPNVTYTMPDDSDGEMQTNYLHDFSQVTLVYWCEGGGFAFFINASLSWTPRHGFKF